MTSYDPRECQGDWIQTRFITKIHILNPSVDEINIQDIAHALSNLCRWNGHTSSFYSVAQHSILVSQNCTPENALWGLLHDATEAYIGDMVRPLKLSGMVDGYVEIEKRMMDCICDKFGLSHGMPPDVKVADNRVLQTEAEQLISPLVDEKWEIAVPYDIVINPLHPRIAKLLFLETFYKLGGKDGEVLCTGLEQVGERNSSLALDKGVCDPQGS